MLRRFDQARRWRRTAFAAIVMLGLGLAGSSFANGLDDVREGNSAYSRGQYERAVEYFTRAIISGDLSLEAMAITLNNRGVVYGQLGDYDRAIQDYEDALALRPEDPKTLKNLRIALVGRGFAHLNLGDYEKARTDYDRAIEIAPDYYLAYFRRGELSLEENKYSEAIADLERAEELEPGERVIADLLTDARRQQQESTAFAQGAVPEAEPTTTTAAAPPSPTEDARTTPAEAESASVEIEAVAEDEPSDEQIATETSDTNGTAAASDDAEPEPQVQTASQERPGNQGVEAAPAAGEANVQVRAINAVNFRAGPGNDYERLGTVDAGVEMPSFGIELGWHQIEAPNGERGYIYQRWLEVIE